MERGQKILGCVMVALVVVLGGCKEEAPLAPESPGSQPETSESRPYSVEAKASSTHVGQEGTLSFVVEPEDGFKWNEKFPAQVILKVADHTVASFEKAEWLQDAFTQVGSSARVMMPYAARRAGKTDVTLQAKFSVCDAKSCIIKTEELKAEIKVLSE